MLRLVQVFLLILGYIIIKKLIFQVELQGQLDEEVKNNSWIVINDFNIDVIFKKINESSWSKLLSSDSFKNKIFSNYPPDPNLN